MKMGCSVWVSLALVGLHFTCIGLLFSSILGGLRSPIIQKSEVDEDTTVTKPVYDRLVVFLVDALRGDMVAERSEMIFVREMLRLGLMDGYIARAHAPTVTMPRIKALMSGNIPQFLDLVTNLATSSASPAEDSLITRLKETALRLVLFGDDTWLKLYPGAFLPRSDGTTSSFFTPDFVEVDYNVTRHLKDSFDETSQHPHSRDWDVAILHYLGLDHVGHQLGPASQRMSEKLVEMDEAFESLVRKVAQQDVDRNLNTLIVLLSDHGMNGAGNHGGSSSQETSAVAAFVHPPWRLSDVPSGRTIKSNHNKIELKEAFQVDLAPTLGLAMGVGIPSNSIGCVLSGAFMNSFSQMDRANLMFLRRKIVDENVKAEICEEYQARLLAHSLKDDLGGGSMLIQTMCILVLFSIALLLIFVHSKEMTRLTIAALALQCLGLASSSAIENEHATVFFLLTTMCVLLAWNDFILYKFHGQAFRGLLFIMLLARVMRSRLEIINFARLAGIRNRVFLNEGTPILPLPLGLGGDVWSPWMGKVLLSGLAWLLSIKEQDELNKMLVGFGFALNWVYMVLFPNKQAIARYAMYAFSFVIARTLLLDRRSTKRALLSAMIGLGMLVIRPALLPIVFAGLVVLLVLLMQMNRVSKSDHAMLFWLSGSALFFAMGNSHSVATIDISGAYVGSEEYNRDKVAFITTFVVYYGPWMSCVTWLMILATQPSLLLVFQSLRLAFYSLILVLMQNHLFIWSVFAPRWGYEILWTVVLDVLLLIWTRGNIF